MARGVKRQQQRRQQLWELGRQSAEPLTVNTTENCPPRGGTSGKLLFPLCLAITLEAAGAARLTVTHGDGSRTTVDGSPRVVPGAFVEWADGGGEAEEAAAAGLSTARQPLQCVGWRGVKGCSPESAGGADPARSLGCHDAVSSGMAGWCECEFSFRVREVGCRHETFTCADECGRSTAEEAAFPTEAAARAELAPTDTVVAEFLQEPHFAFEFAPQYIMQALNRNLPFAIFLLCDCDEDVRWHDAVRDLQRHSAWASQIKGRFVFGFARRAGIESFALLDNFAVEGAPAFGIDNIPVGQNMEKYTFRMEQGGQLKHRPEIGQPPPGVVTGGELADFFLGFLNGSLPLTVKSAPVPQARGAAPGAEKRGAIRGRSRGGGGGGGGGGALELVGSTFRAAVMDESKDVAVLFYAPWCNACELVLPVIDAAADAVAPTLRDRRRARDGQPLFGTGGSADGGAGGGAGGGADGGADSDGANGGFMEEDEVVVVARMDLTENDIPVRGVSVRHYPSLWLWPRGQKHAPLEYGLYNHEREDGLAREHSHYELGMVLDFLTHGEDRAVRPVHGDGDFFAHLMDNEGDSEVQARAARERWEREGRERELRGREQLERRAQRDEREREQLEQLQQEQLEQHQELERQQQKEQDKEQERRPRQERERGQLEHQEGHQERPREQKKEERRLEAREETPQERRGVQREEGQEGTKGPLAPHPLGSLD